VALEEEIKVTGIGKGAKGASPETKLLAAVVGGEGWDGGQQTSLFLPN